MANLHSEFIDFHDRIKLASSKKESLRRSRDAIRDRIRKHFRDVLEVEIPKFRRQGSFAMNTTCNPLDGEFDIDDGVYLQHLDEDSDDEWPTPETVHQWIVKATIGHTNEKPTDKRTCVRVRYAGEYHVDLPVYAKLNTRNVIAEKGDDGWHHSDPRALTDWFTDQVKENGQQLRRIIRYFKAWADFQTGRRGKMPSGLILTILASQYFHANERDDVAFFETAQSMANATKWSFSLFNPVDYSEELTTRLTELQKSRFQKAISDLTANGASAIDDDDSSKSSTVWRKQFGDRFPKIEKDDETGIGREEATRLAAFHVGREPAKPWANHK